MMDEKMIQHFSSLSDMIVLGTYLIAAFLGAARPIQTLASRAYRGHENDADIKAFIENYPKAIGTRLDDCQTCHRGGLAGTDTDREFSPCSYCHLLVFPNAKYKSGLPKSFKDTLNPYGLDYRRAGRRAEAVRFIAGRDSDGDGAPNEQEISDLRYPGDPASRPGQPLAPVVSVSWDEVRKMPFRTQFMLMNASKEPTDDYVLYGGVRVIDLLSAVKIDLKGAVGITVFAPDGYSIDYSLEDITQPFPSGYYYDGPDASEDPERSFVRRPDRLPDGVRDGKEIPGAPWLLLAFERDGKPLTASVYEKGTGRLTGEGPFRLVKPQRDLFGDPAKPGRPDRSQKPKAFGDGWDFNPAIDHNAGACVRGACVIRVNAVPAGFEEYDWKNGWPLVAEKKIVVFGRGVSGRSPERRLLM
jgi:hypothetical protein